MERHKPFSNNEEFEIWKSNNCYLCIKNYNPDLEKSYCEIEEALCLGSISDGTIDYKLADRAGLLKDHKYKNSCKEIRFE